MQTTRSLMLRTRSMSCSMSTIVVPDALISRICSSSDSRSAGLTPAIGSSSSSIRGSAMMARAISSSLRWPPDRAPAGESTICARRKRSSRIRALASFSVSRWRQLRGHSARSNDSPGFDAPSIMLSRTLSLASEAVSWNVRTSPLRAMRSGERCVRSSPSSDQFPLSARSKPVSTLKRVLFPAPFGPISDVILPRPMPISLTSTATTPPYRFTTSMACRM